MGRPSLYGFLNEMRWDDVNQFIVTERLIEREQEPCIIDKMKGLMKEAGFDVIYYQKLPTYPGI